MKTVILLRLGIFAIFAVPMILLNLSAIGRWGEVEQALDPEGQTTAPAAAVAAGKGINNIWRNHRNQREVDVLFNDDGFTTDRVLTHDLVLTVDDVLAPGEDRPDPALDQLYITARAPQYLMQYCDAPLQSFARACTFAALDVDRKKDGRFRVRGDLSYLPVDPSGDVSAAKNAELDYIHLRLPRERDQTRNIAIEKADEVILALHQAARAECSALRDKVGNCVIEHFSISRRDQGETTTITAAARLAWVKLPTVAQQDLPGQAMNESDDASSGIFAKFADFKRNVSSKLGMGEKTASAKGKDVRVIRGGGAMRTGGSAGSWRSAPDAK